MNKICMLGSGAWGTAVSTVLAENGFDVNLWCHEASVVDSIVKKHCNELFLPDISLSERICPFIDMKDCFKDVKWIFEATPVKFLRATLEKAKPHFSESQVWVVLSKGIEQDTLLFPSQIIDDVFKTKVKKVVLSGPSFAKDVALKQLTAVAIASEDDKNTSDLKKVLENDYFKTVAYSDVLGLQIGGSLKNVVAIAIGMLDSAGYADNTKVFALTSFLNEMVTLAQHLGAKKETLYGLSGMGDLVLTCMGNLSRNLKVGKQLGAGKNLDDILAETNAVPEGVNTVKSVYQLMKKLQLDLPLFASIHDVIFGGKTVNDFCKAMMLSC